MKNEKRLRVALEDVDNKGVVSAIVRIPNGIRELDLLEHLTKEASSFVPPVDPTEERKRLHEEPCWWSDKQVKEFVKTVRQRVGNGWEWLTPRVRVALITEEAFTVTTSNWRESVPSHQANKLRHEMLRVANLLDEAW
jgi:hypothetical protein